MYLLMNLNKYYGKVEILFILKSYKLLLLFGSVIFIVVCSFCLYCVVRFGFIFMFGGVRVGMVMNFRLVFLISFLVNYRKGFLKL